MSRLGLLVLLVCILAGCKTESGDSADITITDILSVNHNLENWHGLFPDDPKYNELTQMPVQFSVPTGCTASNQCLLQLQLHPHGGYPRYCASEIPWSVPGHIVVGNCSDSENNTAHAWWGANGNAGRRLAVSANKAIELFLPRLDILAGITLAGASQGGLGSLLYSMQWADEKWRQHISVADAAIHDWFFTAADGYYWKNPAIATLWNGYDISLLNPETNMAAGRLNHIYYKLLWSSNDPVSNPRNHEFLELADQYGVASFGIWTKNNHSAWCEPGINLPCTSRYSGPDSQARLDKPAVIFRHSSANRSCEGRGHHNLGLEWHTKNIVDTQEYLSIPLRYRQHTQTGSACLEQPTSATFSLTIRQQRYSQFKFTAGDVVQVRVGGQTHQVYVEHAEEITLHNITLQTSTEYTTVEVWK